MEVNWNVKIYDGDGLVTDPKVCPCRHIERAVIQFDGPAEGRITEVELPKGTFARSDEIISDGGMHLITEDSGWTFAEGYNAMTCVKLPKEYGFDLCIAPQGFVFEG